MRNVDVGSDFGYDLAPGLAVEFRSGSLGLNMQGGCVSAGSGFFRLVYGYGFA